MINVKFPPFHKLVNKRFAEIFLNKDRYIFLWGGRNSGKSISTSRKLIYRCLNEKYFRCILIKKTFEAIKDSQWQTLKDDIDQLGLSELFIFRKAPLEIECVNGNTFIARGLDKVEKLKSIKDPTGAWYEEGNQITLEDFITVTTSIRSIRADYIQEIFSFNPETEVDYEDFWLWQMFFKGHTEKNFSDTVKIELPNGNIIENRYTSHHTTYHDNKYLTEIQKADLEQWKEINPYYYTIYTLGEWGNKVVKDKFWKSFNRVAHVKPVKLDLELPLHISFDENVNPYPALSIWQVDDKKVKQVHEICLRNPNNKVKKVGAEFLSWAKRNDWSNKVYIYGDATSAKEDTKMEAGVNYFSMLRDIIEQDFPVQIRKPSKNPPVALSAEFVNAIYEMNYQGIDITIGDNCKESINDYSLVQEKTDGTMKKPKDKNGIEILGHLSDCKRYLLIELFKNEFAQYQQKATKITYTLGNTKPERAY